MIYKSRTNEIISHNFKRSSIIPYFISNNENYYFLAIDSESKNLTDMGGKIENGENFLESAIRELEEESLNIFTQFSPSDFKKSISIYDENNIITFKKIKIDFEEADDMCKNFKKKLKKIKKLKNPPEHLIENDSILYISENELKNICKGKTSVKMHEKFLELLTCGFKGFPGLVEK